MQLPWWKKVSFALAPLAILIVLLEVALAVFGIEPLTTTEDPFVGFEANMPLFVETGEDRTAPMLVTAPNKREIFNPQEFHRDKPADTVRVFTVGGSTTYGRPYFDTTSFAGWLRELLPVAAPGRQWEVINAGGISYASYRVARLMEELAEYAPDFVVVYTGHNEFLEERTYGKLRDLPRPVKWAYGAVSRTRTWSALVALRDRPGTQENTDERAILSPEVQAMLDSAAGLQRYERDDALRDGILAHYELSLRRIVELTRSAGAVPILVTPASNLKDFSPFKSQHTDELSDAARERSRLLLSEASASMAAEDWTAALGSLEAAVELDPRHADLHYRRGKALFALGDHGGARAAFERAREEDVCPLRALQPMVETVRRVAQQEDVLLIDFVDLLKRRCATEHGHDALGNEYFLDHVHPTPEAHRLLARTLIGLLADRGFLTLSSEWGDAAVEAVAERVEQSLDAETHALARSNLARTLDWAGKQEEAYRLAAEALADGYEDAIVLLIAARQEAKEGHSDEALQLLLRSLRAQPGNPVIHFQIGMLRAGRNELEAAAGHFFLASLIWSDNPNYHRHLAMTMANRGRPREALVSLTRLKRLAPADQSLDNRIGALRLQIGAAPFDPHRESTTSRHPSGYPETVAQARRIESGETIIDGIWTEWFDGGGLKRFVDYVEGVPHGVSIEWDRDGAVVERFNYELGQRVD